MTLAQIISQKHKALDTPVTEPDTQVFTTMINAYAESGDVDSALVGRLGFALGCPTLDS